MDLLQLTDARLFEEVAEGIPLIVEHAESLESTAVRLREIDEHRAAGIVSGLAKEESAKVLILLDLIRCPRNNQEGRKKTVRAFGNQGSSQRRWGHRGKTTPRLGERTGCTWTTCRTWP